MTLTLEIQSVADAVAEIIRDVSLQPDFAPPQLRQAVLAYPLSGGKALRPALLAWSCRALDGPLPAALRAGAAVELYHTYTLVHDDVIDRDALRRGSPSAHALMEEEGRSQFGLDHEAGHYGLSMAILAGDCQQSWAIALLATLPELGADPGVTLRLIHQLQRVVGPAIVEGEARDIQLPFLPVAKVSEDAILHMVRTKTSALFSYCGWAGGLLARGREDAEVRALAEFGERAGTAFQLQDDVLGLVGSEEKLGKPVGNDLREGKRTLIIALAWARAGEEERAQLSAVLGNSDAAPEAIACATGLLRRLGAIDDIRAMAVRYLRDALDYLDILPENTGVRLLRELAESMVKREK
jgi:geranylgeranyl diphosphate synthase type I